MRYFILILIGVAVGVGGYWYFTEGQRDRRIQDAQHEVTRSATQMGEAIRDKVSEISVEDIKEELARTGRVIRQKAQQAVAAFKGDESEARLTNDVKAKLAADPRLAPRNIQVTVKEGRVTLTGSVESHEEIARAMQLALSAEGVREVVAELQLRRTK
ncbi:MAG TPA: BON domain-containing protein [Verrucomicrobiae bacterium]|jgi:Flp pilus assembly secretin CpaC